MNIPKEKLGVIGLSIKVNRKVKLRSEKSGKWTQTNFAKGICAQKTLINMERGIPGRFFDVYAESAKKLELELRYDPEVDKKINNLIPKLHKAIDFYELKKVDKITKDLLTALEGFKNALWYCDLYKLIDTIRDYYFKGLDLNKNEIENLLEMIDEFSAQTNEILEFLISNSTYNSASKSYVRKIFTLLNLENSELVCAKHCQLMYLYTINKAVSFLALSNSLTDYCIKVKNYIRLLSIYSLTISFLSYYDPDELPNYFDKANELVDSMDIPLWKKAEFYYNIGSAYYEKEDYVSSINAFEKSYAYNKKSKIQNKNIVNLFIFIAGCQRALGLDLSIPFFTNKELQNSMPYIRKLYEYFSMGKEIPAFVRQRYLMDEVLPILESEDRLIIVLLKDELNMLIAETNHYKDSVVYDIKAKELSK